MGLCPLLPRLGLQSSVGKGGQATWGPPWLLQGAAHLSSAPITGAQTQAGHRNGLTCLTCQGEEAERRPLSLPSSESEFKVQAEPGGTGGGGSSPGHGI